MLPDRLSNLGPLTYESVALPIALCGPAWSLCKNGRETCGCCGVGGGGGGTNCAMQPGLVSL